MDKITIILIFFSIPAAFAEDQKINEPELNLKLSQPLNPLLTIPLAPLAVLAPGSAHYIRGDETTSDDLFKLGGNSFLVFLGSALILGASGAADQTSFPFIPLAMGGAAGWLAFSSIDLIGSTLDKTVIIDDPSQNNFSNRLELEYTKVSSPVFENTFYSGIRLSHRGGFGNLEFGFQGSSKGDIRISSLDYGKMLFGRSIPNQGFYVHFKIKHESNRLGFFNMSTLEPTIRLITDASMFSARLSRIYLKAKFGLQQHLLRYDENTGSGYETDSSMVGAFETSWVAYSWLKPLLGYRHERESLVASQTTGFTGVFFTGIELHIGGHNFLKLRTYLGGDSAWDLSVFSSF